MSLNDGISKDLSDFEKKWQERIKTFKNRPLSGDECYTIITRFIEERFLFMMSHPQHKQDFNYWRKLEEVQTDVEIALNLSLAKWKLQNRGFWSKAFQNLKFPITIFKK